MQRHIFVCTSSRGSGKPTCGGRGSEALLAAVQNELIARGSTARATACSCLGPCFDGPNAVVYPDGVWYGRLEIGDAPRLVDHLIDGTVCADRVTGAPGPDET